MDVFKEEKQALLKENRHTQGALEELRVVLETAEQAVLNVLAPYEDAGDRSAQLAYKASWMRSKPQLWHSKVLKTQHQMEDEDGVATT
jgi:hypothetical protein